MNPSSAPRSLLALAAAASLLGACGSDDEPGPPETPEAVASAAPAQTLQVTETDFTIDPARGKVAGAGPIRISVTNAGEKPHALAIETPTGLVQSDTLAGGEADEVGVTLEAGEYIWFCPVGDHRQRGMEGTLIVGPSGNGPAETETRSKSGTY